MLDNMSHTYVKLPVHGDLEHFLFLSIASYLCWKRGFTFLDGSGFAFKHKCPGIPDIYVKYPMKVKDEFGTRRYDQYAVIEIETHANTKDTQKKISQFESQAQNVKLCIVPMNKFDAWKERQIKKGKDFESDLCWYSEFIDAWLPQSEVN